MTQKETAQLVALALANWPGMQDKGIKIEVTAALWHQMMGHLPYTLVEAGLAKILMTAKFFPTVAEIIEATDSLRPKPNALPSPEEAWDEVCRNLDPYLAPSWSHEAIRRTVSRLGGIRTLCECDNMAPARAHFFKLYEMEKANEKEKGVNAKVAALISSNNIKFIS